MAQVQATSYIPTFPGAATIHSALDVISKPENQAQASAGIRTVVTIVAISISPGGAVMGAAAVGINPIWTKFVVDLIDTPLNRTWNGFSTKEKVGAAVAGVGLVAAGGIFLSVPVFGSAVSCLAMGFAAKAGAEMTLRNLDRK